MIMLQVIMLNVSPPRAHNNKLYKTYEMYVVFFTELKMLSQANVFIGTYSSNVGRMIVLLRESRGMPRSSSLSLDHPDWFPNRHLLVAG